MKEKYLSAFFDMTVRFAQTSEATRLKVGACILKNGNPIAFGVNGTLPGWPSNVCEGGDGKTLDNVVVHAERNALNKLRKIGESSVGATLLVTHSPCIWCATEILDAGIQTVYYLNEYRSDAGIIFLRQKGVRVEKYVKSSSDTQVDRGDDSCGCECHSYHPSCSPSAETDDWLTRPVSDL